MISRPYENYKKTQIQTSTQGKLIIMLYDGAIKYLNIAIENVRTRKYDVVNDSILKTQDIITELMLALNMDIKPLSSNLYMLYDFINRRLIEANIKKNVEIMKQIIEMLLELKIAWDSAIRKVQEQKNVAPPEEMASSRLNVKG